MISIKRLLQLFLLAAACTAGYAVSMLGCNFMAASYPGGPTQTSQDKLRAAVTTLAVDIGPRDLYNNNLPRLRKAEAYIEARFKAAGCEVQRQEYVASGVKVRNISCVKTGASAPGEVIVVGAHYDTYNNPGADDNASGTAGVLELADYARGKRYARTVKFVAFVNEEPPFFRNEGMGSKVYADAAAARGEDIKAALVLEMIGYFSEARFSQRYPPLVGIFLPDRGNFMAQVSDLASRALAGRADLAFRSASALPLRTVSLPSFVRGADFSDHRSFWAHGWPAVMFTDTSFYRTPHYHKASDLPATLNFEYMAAFLDGMRGVLDELAG
jgi:hypothetical protein